MWYLFIVNAFLQKDGDGSSGPPQPLHITRSVYIRHLPPKIAAEDIVAVRISLWNQWIRLSLNSGCSTTRGRIKGAARSINAILLPTVLYFPSGGNY